MKRFYLVYTEGLNSISVKLRTNHEMIYPTLKLDNPEDLKVLKSLYKMSIEEFITLVRKEMGERPLKQHKQLTSFGNTSHGEEWYNGAWKYSTSKVEKLLKLGESPEMDENEFFDTWENIMKEEKRLIEEERRNRLAKEREAEQKALMKKPSLKRKVEERVEAEDDYDINAMVEMMFGALNTEKPKRGLVKKSKKTLNRKKSL